MENETRAPGAALRLARSRRAENRIISKCLALLGLHADSCKQLRTWAASTNRTGELGKTEFGSSGRTRTYNPSVNSRTACSRLALQTLALRPAKVDLSRKLGGLWGTLGEII